MVSQYNFVGLVGDIYDAALEPARWNKVLEKIAAFAGCCASGLVSRDQLSKSANVHYQTGVEPHYVEAYESYAKLDPLTVLPFFEVEQIISTHDVVPYDEFRASRFYREWARPQGLIDAANALLDKSQASCAFISVIRNESQGLVDDEMRRRMSLIVPHVRRAVLIGKAIELKRVEAAVFADVLDGLSAGMILVDANGRIVHVNAAGHMILGMGSFLRAKAGRLLAANLQADQTLREVFVAAGSGDAALGSKGIAVPLGMDGSDRYVAHVLPLTSGERRRAGLAYAAAAAVFVRKATMEAPSVPEVIAKSYKLTPTELRVLLAVVEVGGAPEVAERLGVALTTVKTHLSRLYEKTGTGRQADLVKLVAGFSSVLAS